MTRYAHVQEGQVVNVILWDGVTDLGIDAGELHALDAGSPVSIGWTHHHGAWEEPSSVETPPQPDYRELRRAAFSAEADPIFFEWQRGESTEQAWLNKVAEIRARYPATPDDNG